MYIKELSLVGFRNLEKMKLNLAPGINIFYGENAQGKTNILESIYVCATGRSQRTKTDSQLIQFNKQESHIQIIVSKKHTTDRIDIHLKKEGKKGAAINGFTVKKLGELFGCLHTVIFSPEDLNLIKEGPGERRRFLDMELCQLSHVYYYNLQQYYKVLKQRNNLLKKIQKNNGLSDMLSVWDEQLVDFGKKIMEEREKFVDNLSDIAAKKHSVITGEKERLKIIYKPNTSKCIFYEKLVRQKNREIIMGTTLTGPHKDDILFLINETDVKLYGSQGQQRTAALCAKLAEIELIQNETGHCPVLLLDDVLSELDVFRQRFLLESIKGMQAIITCTGVEDVIKKYIGQCCIYYVKKGKTQKKEQYDF